MRNTLLRPRAGLPALLALILASLAVVGCGDSSSHPQSQGSSTQSDSSEQRIVSLAPAITRMLLDLDQGGLLVGVAQNDMVAPAGLPVVGNYVDINSEALLATHPQLVLTMSGKEGPPARLKELASKNNFLLISYEYPKTINDVGRIIYDEHELVAMFTDATGKPVQAPPSNETPSLGTILGMTVQAQRLKYTMLSRLAAIEAAAAKETAPKPSVLLVIGTGPVMASGPGTVNDELIGFAGGHNAADKATVAAPTFDREGLLQLKPDIILLLLPEAAPLGPFDTDSRLAEFRGLADVPAVANQKIYLINSPLVALPSSSLDKVGALMAKAIHPDLAAEIDKIMASDFKTLTQKIPPHAATEPASRPSDRAATQPAPAGP